MGLPDSLLALSVGGCICDLNTLCLSNSYQTLNFPPATVFVIVAVVYRLPRTHWLTLLFWVLCLFREVLCLVNSSYHLHLLAGYVFGRVFQGQQSLHKDPLTQNVRPTYWEGGRQAHPSLDS